MYSIDRGAGEVQGLEQGHSKRSLPTLCLHPCSVHLERPWPMHTLYSPPGLLIPRP